MAQSEMVLTPTDLRVSGASNVKSEILKDLLFSCKCCCSGVKVFPAIGVFASFDSQTIIHHYRDEFKRFANLTCVCSKFCGHRPPGCSAFCQIKNGKKCVFDSYPLITISMYLIAVGFSLGLQDPSSMFKE